MPCGKRPLIKSWDKPRTIKVITPSRYEQNEASVKVHWKNVIRELELSYKDEQFWESQSNVVRELVGPIVYTRIAKIFNLPLEATQYLPASEASSLVPSEKFYQTATASSALQRRSTYSMSDFVPSTVEALEEEESELWSISSQPESTDNQRVSRKSILRKSSKSISRVLSKSSTKFLSKISMRASGSKMFRISASSTDETASSSDDIRVQHSKKPSRRHRHRLRNPHFDMLYCNDSETDMIKWNSKYKQKTFEVSASDEFSKKAEIMTKKISKEFFDWWVNLGSNEFKSEIKRPEDIEDLFQVWFDEHASRSLILDPKTLPCVLHSIAKYIGVLKSACPNALKRQIAHDIHAETSPAHVLAFDTTLPQKMKHIPPNNNTEAIWHCVKIPDDLRTMACVWEDIQHLTSTKAFQKWLQQHPNMPMPSCLANLDATDDKKQLFVVPSDYVIKDKSTSASMQELALPVSQFNLELKEVLSKIMN